MLVALSVLMLLAAPLVAAALLRRPSLAAALDGFVLVAVGGIVALHVVPQSAELAGPVAILAAAAGLFVPIALHRVDDAVLASAALSSSGRSSARRARDLALFAVFVAGVVVHALFDGAALAPQADGGVDALALGVILHRVPVGLALWTVGRPKLGNARTLGIVATYAAGTVVGSLVGPSLLAHASAPGLAVFQAFVAGSILHIVAESPPLPVPRPRPGPLLLRAPALRAAPPSSIARAAALAGSALAVAALWLTERAHGGHGEDAHAHDALAHAPGFVDALVALSLTVAPAALASFVVVGVLYALWPEHAPLRRAGRAGRAGLLGDAVRGTAAGLPHPLCSCAVAPLYDELVDDDAPPASARAFLVAAPSLGVPALFVGLRLLGAPFTALRVLGAAALALAAGLSAAGARASPTDPATPAPPPIAPPVARPALGRRVAHGLRHGVVDAVDHVGPWLLLGVALAAAIEVNVGAHALARVPAGAQVIVATLASLPLYLCAAGSVPVAFALLAKGASAGAVLAFLVVGPTTSLATFALVRRHHGRRAALALAAAVVVAAAAVGVAVDAAGPLPSLSVARDVAGGGGPVTLVQVLSLGCLVLLLGASFVRQGVRGFLVQVMSPQHSHAGDDVHGPNCAHDHGPALAPPPVVRVALPFDPRGPS